jgi:hypothetical protein
MPTTKQRSYTSDRLRRASRRADLVRDVETAERALVESALRSGRADFDVGTPLDFLARVSVPADLVQAVMRAHAALAAYGAKPAKGTPPR